MEASKLKEILEQHKLWVDGKGGKRALLEGANLGGADLGSADLRDANFTRANLTRAKLTGTILDKKAEKKAEKQPEVASVKAESTIRSEIEAIAKKHGMKIASLTLELL